MPQKKPLRKYQKQQHKRSHAEHDEIKRLEVLLAEQAPPPGSNPLAAAAGASNTLAAARTFEDLPLSQYTKDALKEAEYVTLTAIQRAALPHALCGRDVLGAAKTGSGKTLAFIIPLVEALYRQRWNRLDGLGALVVSPTRELAVQIFEELRKVGRRHELSAGLLIGGKDVAEEAALVAGLNILVATPGRLLQHLDETPGFDPGSLQVLVLDEADRILDMGFSATLNAILSNLPLQRQTLLFSATQTKSVAALARLSLKDPEYVEAHAEAAAPTPVRLEQAFMEVAPQEKLDTLWSFIKTHLRGRTIIFLSTCKQVRFVYEAFRRLRPGVPLRALHGRMAQARRMAVFQDFCASKAGVLLATDVAARGLDFPGVDWVVQADCPEDVASYIHRVGRTARYTSAGRGLLLLLPGEREGMVAALAAANVPVKELRRNPAKLQPVTPSLQALLSKDSDLKDAAQRALVAYLRSVFLQPDRRVFDVAKLPVAELALSMGLPTVPKLRFLRRAGKANLTGGHPASNHHADGEEEGGRAVKRSRAQQGTTASGDDGSSSGSDEEGEEGGEDVAGVPGSNAMAPSEEEAESEDELLLVKRRHVFGTEPAALPEPPLGGDAAGSKRKKRLRISAHRVSGSRMVFDEEGQAVDPLSLLGSSLGGGTAADGDGTGNGSGLQLHASVEARGNAARAALAARDAEDRAALRTLRKQQRDQKRARRLADEQEEAVAAFGGSESDDESGEGRFGSDVDLLLDSDEDSGDEAAPARPPAGAEVAHMGMAPAAAVPAAHSRGGKAGKRSTKGGAAKGLSLADQEALALQMLRR